MEKLVKKNTEQEPEFMANTLRIASLAADRKAVDVKAFDVRELTALVDSFVLCSASSEPHFKAIYNAILEGMKEVGVQPLRCEGEFSGRWLLLDYGTIFVHIFREEAREFYDLDGLWGDAPPVDLDLDL